MTSSDAAHIQVMESHGWHVSFRVSEETHMTWWEARTPEDPEITVIAVSIEDLWMVWLDQPLVIKKLFGIEVQCTIMPVKSEADNAIRE